MSHRSSFGVDLNSSSYELHPSNKDSADTLQGSYCCAMRFSDNLSSQILDFVNSRKCHAGMQIGQVQFVAENRGKISFESINESLSNCVVTVTKEANINTEVYETEYDRPPSNAMFLRRKGFVHSKLIIKPGSSTDRSITIRNPMPHKRATTTFKEVKGSQRLGMKQRRNNKRRMDSIPVTEQPNKRLKPTTNVSLSEAVSHILCIGDASFDDVRKIITSRTSLSVNIDALQSTLHRIATFNDPQYRLKPELLQSVNWKNSSVLTQSEKHKITNRIQSETKNVPLGIDKELEREYSVIYDATMYAKYNEIYQKKFEQQTTFLKSVNENQNYFKKMRSLIKAQADTQKKTEMKEQLRKIFEERKNSIKDMKDKANKLGTEIKVIKHRIDAYVHEQTQLQRRE